jgi:DNA-binding transcriptional ArsR family regulator
MDAISNTFSALADPTRRAILARLALGESSVTELAAPFEMSMPAVSKHLRVLERAGLVERGRDAQFRPCRLRAQPLETAASWIETYRRFWEESFDRLDDYLQRLQQEQGSPPGMPPVDLPPGARVGAKQRAATVATKKMHKEKRNGTRPRKHA